MTADLAIVLALLTAAIVMFAMDRPRMDVVGLIMMAALPVTGVISSNEALAGFSDPNIVLIAMLFVLGEALVRTGVVQELGDFLMRHAGSSETRLIVMLMLTVAGVGSVMSSTGVVAIFIPVVLRIARNARIAPGRLMMPLSMAALLSGMMTLIATTPNLVVHAELIRHGSPGFDFFTFTPFGLSLLFLGIIYMLFARRFLGGEAEPEAGTEPRLAEWIREYGLQGRELRLRVRADSPAAGRALEELDLRATRGINILAIERMDRRERLFIPPRPTTRIRADDLLFIDLPNPLPDQDAMLDELKLESIPFPRGYLAEISKQIGMAEMIVPPNSGLEGNTIAGSRLRTQYDLTVLGLKQGRTAKTGQLTEEVLSAGDTLLVVGPWRAIDRHRGDFRDLIAFNLPRERADVVAVRGRMPHAVAILLFVIAMMVTGILPNVLAALIGCLLMGLFGCLDMHSAYRAIHWKSLILIVGMLPFSLALQNTGGIDLAADGLIAVVGDYDAHLTLAVIFLTTSLLGLFVSNTATAVLMAPIAVEVANELSASPYPFAMTVALAASAAFMTPVSSPVNTLVVGPGDYSFMDFVRIGTPFTLVALLVSVFLVPILLPL